MQERRQPEIIAGRVNADGSIAAGDGFTVVKGATGAYTINFPSSFRVVGYGSAPVAANIFTRIDASSATSLTFSCLTTSTLALTDGAFTFVAVGVQQ